MPKRYWWYIAAFILIVALAAIGMYVQAHAQDCATLVGNGLALTGNETTQGRNIYANQGMIASITDSRIPGAPGVTQGGGARLQRYVNRQATGEPLTPWPMESRAVAELGVSVNAIIEEYAGR